MPFKIYTDFECNVKNVNSSNRSDKANNTSYTEKDKEHIPCSFAYKVICVDKKFSKSIVLYRGGNAVNKFIEAILKEYEHCKEVTKSILIRI